MSSIITRERVLLMCGTAGLGLLLLSVMTGRTAVNDVHSTNVDELISVTAVMEPVQSQVGIDTVSSLSPKGANSHVASSISMMPVDVDILYLRNIMCSKLVCSWWMRRRLIRARGSS